MWMILSAQEMQTSTRTWWNKFKLLLENLKKEIQFTFGKFEKRTSRFIGLNVKEESDKIVIDQEKYRKAELDEELNNSEVNWQTIFVTDPD